MPECPNCGSTKFQARVIEEVSYNLAINQGATYYDFNEVVADGDPSELKEVFCDTCGEKMHPSWLEATAKKDRSMVVLESSKPKKTAMEEKTYLSFVGIVSQLDGNWYIEDEGGLSISLKRLVGHLENKKIEIRVEEIE